MNTIWGPKKQSVLPCAAFTTNLQGADPWIQDHCGGRTALHYVALRAGADTAQALLQEVAPSAMITRMGTRMVT